MRERKRKKGIDGGFNLGRKNPSLGFVLFLEFFTA